MNVRSVRLSSGITASLASASRARVARASASTTTRTKSEAASGSKLCQLGCTLPTTLWPSSAVFCSSVSRKCARISVKKLACSGIDSSFFSPHGRATHELADHDAERQRSIAERERSHARPVIFENDVGHEEEHRELHSRKRAPGEQRAPQDAAHDESH